MFTILHFTFVEYVAPLLTTDDALSIDMIYVHHRGNYIDIYGSDPTTFS